MKKFVLMGMPVLAVLFAAGWAFTSPEAPQHRDRGAIEEVFALAGNGYRIGVVLSGINPHLRDDLKIQSGILVEEVLSDSPAQKAGMKDGDIILKMDGKEIETEQDIRKILRGMEDSREVTMEILRDGKPLTLTVTPEKKDLRIVRSMGGNYIGVELQELNSDLASYFGTQPGSGVLVARVEEDSPANKAGLKSGDVITEFNGTKVTSAKDLRSAIDDVQQGQTASMTVLRHNKVQQLSVKPEQRAFPQIEQLRELNLPELESLKELRDLPEMPDVRDSMKQLKDEMHRLKIELKDLHLNKEEVQELREEIRKEMENVRKQLEEIRKSD